VAKTPTTTRFVVPIEQGFVFPNTVQQIQTQFCPNDSLEDPEGGPKECVIVLPKRPIGSNTTLDQISEEELHDIGVRCEVVQFQDQVDGPARLLVEGQEKVWVKNIHLSDDGILLADIEPVFDQVEPEDLSAQTNTVYQRFKEHLNAAGEVLDDTILAILDVDKPAELTDLIGSYLDLNLSEKQEILEETLVSSRLEKVLSHLNQLIIDANLEQSIDGIVQSNVETERKEMLLKAKLRAIQMELGQSSQEEEINRYRERLRELALTSDAHLEIEKEINKLERSPDESTEAGVIRAHLDFVLDLPWRKQTRNRLNINKVRETLSKRHFGLDDVKERILEYLAVKKLSKNPTSNILCLVGPPGVGKTSVVKSVAKALDRKYYRIALGGIRDEADLRGHRRTYVGALPGKIISAIYKAQSINPVILLDEIDKMASGFKGDPSSVLLEILDPEQNDTFMDHYIQVPFNLSQTLFICTANNMSDIPAPLLNRLEIIQISGYTLSEKIELAQHYLLPKQIKAHGLSKLKIKMNRAFLEHLIAHYTADVGLRELDRCFQRLLRKLALKKVSGEPLPAELSETTIQEFLGPGISKPNFSTEPRSGRSVALYTVGMIGNCLPIEAAVYSGTGQILATGNIDPLLQETIKTTISYIKTHHKEFGLSAEILTSQDVHVHFHKQQLEKKGEGWGLAVFTAILSAILDLPLQATVAFAGQISLLGKVLPTEALEQKLLAASQLGITTVVASAWNFEEEEISIPSQLNVLIIKDLTELPSLLRSLSSVQ
jgi:ATP-dependent Lon protease